MLDSNRMLTLEVNKTLAEAIYDTEENATRAIRKESFASLERDKSLRSDLNATAHNINSIIEKKGEEIEDISKMNALLEKDISKLGLYVNNRFANLDENVSLIYATMGKNKKEFDMFYDQVNEAIKAINSNFKELEENIHIVDEKAINNYEALARVDIELQEVKTIQLKQEQRDIGTLVWAYECDDSIGLYELDGSKYQDEKLSDYLFLNDLDGFSIEDDVIDTPNLKGRFLGYSGALGVGDVGSVGADKTAVNGLNIQIGIDEDTGDGDYYKYWAVGGVAHPRYGFTTMDNFFYSGDTETLPNWYALKLCIKGKF